MFEIYDKSIASDFAGYGIESLIVQNGVILAHVRTWDNPQVVEDDFKATLTGKAVAERGNGWRKLQGQKAENAQAWAKDICQS